MKKLILFLILLVAAFSETKIELTQEEKEFIKNHPIIKFGVDTSKAPYAFFDENGNIIGIDPDFIKEINKLSGLNIELVSDRWGNILEKIKNKELDGAGIGIPTKERAKYAIFTKSYMKMEKYLYKKNNTNWQFKTLEDLKGKKVAFDITSAADKQIIESLDGIIPVPINGIDDGTNKLLKESVDAYIASDSLLWYASKNFISNIEIVHEFNNFNFELSYIIRNDYKELQSIINKALDALTNEKKHEIISRWKKAVDIKLSSFILTKDEKEWLSNINEIRVGVESIEKNHKPYIFLENGKISGIVGDYLELFSKAIDKKIKPIIKENSQPNKEIELFLDNVIDIAFYQFSPKELLGDSVIESKGHRNFPMAIFTSIQNGFISSLQEARYKKIVACSEYAAKIIRYTIPNADIKACNNPKEGIMDIVSGKRDLLIGNLAIISNYIREMGVNNIKVTAIVPIESKIYLAATPNMQPLVNMFDRFMEFIPDEKHKEIYDKWFTLKFQKSVDYSTIIYIVVGFFAAIALIAFWNATLVREIKKRKIIEEKLKKSEEKFRKIFKYTQIGIAIGNVNGVIVDTNEAFCKIIGYEKDELLNLNFSDFTHKEDLKKEMTLLDELIRGKREFYRMEKRYIHKNGNIVWVDIVASVVIDEKNNCIDFFIGAINDITERKKLEEELHFLNEQLAQQVELEVAERIKLENEKRLQEQLLIQNQKMAEMGEMIGVIAHQWKQPLNAISIHTQMLKEYYEYGELNLETIKEHEKSIIEHIRFMNQTVNDFKNFFKPDREMVLLNLKSEIEAVIRMLSIIFAKNEIKVSFKCFNECSVFGYSNELKQVLLNIINNAKDAILERKVQNGNVLVTLDVQNEMAYISIKDNGGGIPENLLPDKIFENYFSTKGDKGTGIGLAMAKKIIEDRMKGKIVAKNIENGAEFIITLPIQER